MHPLKHDTVRVAFHIQHPFISQHIRSVNLHDSGQELLELRAIERLVRAEREGADVLVVLMFAVLEESRIELEGRVEVETADIENVLDRRIAEMDFPYGGPRIHLREALSQHFLLGFRHEVGLGHENPVGEPDLLLGLVELVELPRGVLCVHQSDDAVQKIIVADLLVDEEALSDRARIGHARRLDDHALEFELAGIAPLPELPQDTDEVAAHGAADATVVHLDDLLAGFAQEDFVVHTRLAELVLDHRDAVAVLLLEDTVDERGLAASQEAGEYGHRNHVFLSRQFHLLALFPRARWQRNLQVKNGTGSLKKGRITARPALQSNPFRRAAASRS